MSILERNAVAHYGVLRDGAMRPVCLSWRSTWNWTRTQALVTCPQCLVALAARPPAAADAPGGLPPEE